MKPGDARTLLGGYAAGTLTDEERRALFEAALADQDLFSELGREQALKELLDDPGARRQLLAALGERPSLVGRLRAWLGRPVAWAAVGSLAVGTVLVMVLVRRPAPPPPPEPVLIAKLQVAEAPESRAAPRAIPPAPAPAREETESAPAPQTVEVTAGAVPAQLAKSEERDKLVDARLKDAAPATMMSQFRAAPAKAGGGVVGGVGYRMAAAAGPVLYKILRTGADGSFAEADPGTVFRSDEQIRVVFGPTEEGRLLVTVAGRPAPLFDAGTAKGSQSGVDVPAGVERITVFFTPRGAAQVGSEVAAGGRGSGGSIEIRIPREAGP